MNTKNDMHAMTPEIYEADYKGVAHRVHLTHADVLAQLAKVNLAPPTIPPGYNTVALHFQLLTGEYAIVFGQCGFARSASDNEREVNSLGLCVLLDRAWSAADARAILKSIALNRIETTELKNVKMVSTDLI